MKALQRKARFYAPVQATAIEDGREQVVVATSGGPTITARHLVLATGYELTDIIPKTAHSVVSTWAIATVPQPKNIWPGAALIWEASEPYLYLRATEDGRVICGGEDEEFTDEARRDALIADKAKRLAKKLHRLLPRLTSPRIHLDRLIRHHKHRHAVYRRPAPASTHPCGDGLWRQRHHLLANRFGDRRLGDRRC